MHIYVHIYVYVYIGARGTDVRLALSDLNVQFDINPEINIVKLRYEYMYICTNICIYVYLCEYTCMDNYVFIFINI
jgi:hypothetical protein